MGKAVRLRPVPALGASLARDVLGRRALRTALLWKADSVAGEASA